MPDINYLLIDKRFLGRLLCFKTLIIFIDTCLRDVGQVMFANNPLSKAW